MNESIAKAVSILRMSTDFDDDAVLNRIVSSGMERRLAARLVDFLPMAYARLLLERSGAVLPDFYFRLSPTGNLVQHSLDSEPVWKASIEFAKAEIAMGTISSQDLLAIAARSAEFDAANNALNAGHALKDGVFSPCTLNWPEDS
jgi:hypothetical protein